MKKALIIIGIVIGIFLLLIVIGGIFLVNNESSDYRSHYSYTDAESLKKQIKESGNNAIVIITSPSCPGVPEFMPKIENQQTLLEQQDADVYYVVDMLNRETNDSLLTTVINKYNIQYSPLIIDPLKHPSGNLFNASRKYDTFLNELCGTCNDGSLGYPFYVYYKAGEYIDKSYFLNNEILERLN
ncbi:hypothetical protein POV26_10685 [Aequorivita todarodis]|uniref:hypothetical protein n=1 Tax=Aequorivita todarodis TaxID=2036821 RepID=UPI002350893A|nr:hypothetical protein [Aequorivita todarodis]MDC8001504.1 hypothetical protein [Aequorivita todarodis]